MEQSVTEYVPVISRFLSQIVCQEYAKIILQNVPLHEKGGFLLCQNSVFF